MITIHVEKLPSAINKETFEMTVPEIPRKGDYIWLDNEFIYTVKDITFYRSSDKESSVIVSVSASPRV